MIGLLKMIWNVVRMRRTWPLPGECRVCRKVKAVDCRCRCAKCR